MPRSMLPPNLRNASLEKRAAYLRSLLDWYGTAECHKASFDRALSELNAIEVERVAKSRGES